MAESKMSIKKATLINSAAKYYNVICAFVVNMILARILTPAEYGVVAVVTVYTTFFALFSDLGFGVAYIQNRELTEEDKNILFTFLVYVGLALFLIFSVFAYGIAWFYESDVYIRVSQLLGVNLFLTAVNVIPAAELLKQQRFKTTGITQAISATIAAVCAVIFAKNGFSYYSIVLQSILNTLITAIVFICLSKVRFVFRVRIATIRKVLGFSMGQIGFNIINYFSRNLDNLLIGKYFGDTALGYYDKAYKTTTYALSNFSSIIGSSIQPVLSKYQDDKTLVYDKFRRVFLFLVIIGAYLSVSLNLASREAILFLYGDQWEQSIVAFSLLALSLFAQMPLSTAGSFFQVLNNTRLLALSGFISAVLIVGGISAGLIAGSIEAVALGFLAAQCVNFAVVLWLMSKKLFKRSFADLLTELAKLLIVSAATYAICRLVFPHIVIGSYFILLAVKMLCSGLIYLALLFAFRLEKYVITMVFPKYSRK